MAVQREPERERERGSRRGLYNVSIRVLREPQPTFIQDAGSKPEKLKKDKKEEEEEEKVFLISARRNGRGERGGKKHLKSLSREG